MKKRIDKKAQQILGLSFGVIFSIILIVFFIAIVGIVIKSFLQTGDCAKLGIFTDSFKSDVRKSWNSQYDKHAFNGRLPSGIDYICFANLSAPVKGGFEDIGYDLGLFVGRRANTFFYPTTKACENPYNQIDHLDIEGMTKRNNPNCISVVRGKVELQVEKELNDRFVNVG